MREGVPAKVTVLVRDLERARGGETDAVPALLVEQNGGDVFIAGEALTAFAAYLLIALTIIGLIGLVIDGKKIRKRLPTPLLRLWSGYDRLAHGIANLLHPTDGTSPPARQIGHAAYVAWARYAILILILMAAVLIGIIVVPVIMAIRATR